MSTASRLVFGCMHLGGGFHHEPLRSEERTRAFAILDHAVRLGIRTFDHADIYCFGKSEQVFGEWLRSNPGLRSEIEIQTKCSIRIPGFNTGAGHTFYDLSDEHIRYSLNQSLERLQTDRVDVLLLHRPDPLTPPAELAGSMKNLMSRGLLTTAGTSNFPPAKAIHLKHLMGLETMVNQIQFSLFHAGLLEDEIAFNLPGGAAFTSLDGLGLFHEAGILLQAWSPLGGGSSPHNIDGNSLLWERVVQHANQKGISPYALLLAWILALPGPVRPVIGTMNLLHLEEAVTGDASVLEKPEWYALLIAARGSAVP